VCDSGVYRKITNDSKTFELKNLKLTIVRIRCIAPYRGCVSTERISDWYKVCVLCGDSVESWARNTSVCVNGYHAKGHKITSVLCVQIK
jgi:hypothetical protein